MNEQPPMDAEMMPPDSTPEEPQKALALLPGPIEKHTAPPQVTAQQSRIEAVADLTKAALARAGTLMLTAEETAALTADFPDEDFRPGAGGKENLIYIEHAALRDRLNKTLGLGQWAIIVRETWNEDFKTKAYAGKPAQDGVRVYVRAMLLVRGVYVAEAVGDMDYYPHNASQNYGDAFEGSKTAAFRRCAKEFGVGLQAWRKEWCEQWWDRKREASKTVYNEQRAAASPRPAPKANAPQARAQAQEPAKTTTSAHSAPSTPTAASAENAAKWKKYALDQIKKFHMEQFAYAIAMEDSWVVPGVDKLEDISPQKFPNNQPAWSDYWSRVKGRRQKAIDEQGMPQEVTEAFDKAYAELPLESPGPKEPHAKEPSAPPNVARSVPPPVNATRQASEWFLEVVVPIPHKGEKRDEYLKNPDTIGSLYDASKEDEEARRRLFGFAEHYQPEGWVKRDGTKMPPNEVDIKFREALDAFMDWRETNKDEDDIPF